MPSSCRAHVDYLHHHKPQPPSFCGMRVWSSLFAPWPPQREHRRSGLLRGASPETQMSDASLGRLRAKYHGIATAVLSGCRKLTADGLSALLRGQLPATQPISMVGLDLTGCRVTEQWLAMIAASCTLSLTSDRRHLSLSLSPPRLTPPLPPLSHLT